jgi:metal-responsive CopG/Arc/MetJ family transcriptional regulator
MRTTISIDGSLLRRAKRHASQTDRSLSALIEDALRETLARRQQSRRKPTRIQLTVVKGRRRSGVNYDSLAELMELTAEAPR